MAMFWTVVVALKLLCTAVIIAGIAMIGMGQMREPFLTMWFVTACFVNPGLIVTVAAARWIDEIRLRFSLPRRRPWP